MLESAPGFRCEAVVESIGSSAIVRLPEDASRKLPSRGQVAVAATITGRRVETVLEPDGSGGHWLRVDWAQPGVRPGDRAALHIELLQEWPQPRVPADLERALAVAPERVQQLWGDITPMARWEWVRWINATRNPDTRARRIQVALSKLGGGKRRPCCFDLSSCTDPELSSNGKLRMPAAAP